MVTVRAENLASSGNIVFSDIIARPGSSPIVGTE